MSNVKSYQKLMILQQSYSKNQTLPQKDPQQRNVNYSPIYSLNESFDEDHQKLYGNQKYSQFKLKDQKSKMSAQTSPQRQKAFLFKRAASQQNILSQIHRQEYQDTPETFLQPLRDRRNSIQQVEVDERTYKCFTSMSPKFQGIQTDITGKLLPRKILGSVEMFKEGEGKIKNVLNLKLLASKNTMRSGGGFASLNLKSKGQRSSNLNDFMSQNRGSRDESRELLSVRTKNNNNMQSKAQSKTSVQGNNNAQGSTISEERGKAGKHKFIKFDDETLRDAINSIQDRVKINQNLTTTNFNTTGTSIFSNCSKSSTLGALLKEVRQDRVLKQHQDYIQDWQNQSHRLNHRIFQNKIVKKQKGMLKTQNQDNFQSVMMRDQAFQENKQICKAVNHMRDQQHINQNVGWIFSLRQSQFDDQRKSQQYLPSLNGINAVIVPKRDHVDEVYLKQNYESDEEESQIQVDQTVNEHFDIDITLRKNRLSIIDSVNSSIVNPDSLTLNDISKLNFQTNNNQRNSNIRLYKQGFGILVQDLDPNSNGFTNHQNTSRLDLQGRDNSIFPSDLRLNTYLQNQAQSQNVTQRKLIKVSSTPNIKNSETFKKILFKEKTELDKVFMNTSIENLKKLKISGKSKLQNEIKSSFNVPEYMRRYVLNHQYTEDGIGEPVEREEILAEYYDGKYLVQ
eukprot:403370607